MPTFANAVEDGPRNTIFLLEVDDALAVPWTEPRDYELKMNDLTRQLGSLRGDSFYVVWGSGEVGRILKGVQKNLLRAAFTFEGGEDFVAGKIDQPIAFTAAPVSTTTNIAGEGTASESASGNVSAFTHSSPSLGPLAAKFADQSAEAAERGEERAAQQWFFASAVASPPGGSWTTKYQWVPALKRPSAGIRFGIGLQYNGPRRSQLEQEQSGRAQKGTRGGKSVWTTATKEIGKSLVDVIVAHVEQSGAAAFAAAPVEIRPGRAPVRAAAPQRRSSLLLESAHGEPLAPGVHFLTLADEPILKQMARREGIDVLLLVDWKDLGHKQTVRFELIDPIRDASLLNLPWVESTDVADALADPLGKNPLPERLRQLSEFLEQQLSPQPLPTQIQPRHVVGRLTALAASKPENPLAALAEMRYYRERGLVDDAQLLLAFQSLLGSEQGSMLFLGDAEKREQVLKPWLPTQPVATPSAVRTATVSDD
jgi:hypothetical protein